MEMPELLDIFPMPVPSSEMSGVWRQVGDSYPTEGSVSRASMWTFRCSIPPTARSMSRYSMSSACISG
jgi:hypothetical protein